MSGTKKKPSAIEGSRKARQQAAAILAVLGGDKTTAQASAMMKVSLPRYYQLEFRALAGMVAALEPRSKGRSKTPEAEIAGLTKETRRLQKELTRAQALVRAAHRSLGLRDSTRKANGKPKRPSRKHNRAKRAISRLVRPGEEETTVEMTDG
jgi:hypothetical protein